MTLPLPLYTSQTIGEIITDGGERLTLVFGLDKLLVDAFKKCSCNLNDTELHRFTSDHKRICLGSYEEWYAKERYPFALVNEAHELAAIAWFGPKEHPFGSEGNWHTFALRTYNPYRGKRLAFPFADQVIKVWAKMFPNCQLWLDTDLENAGAIRLYQKLGFIEEGKTEHPPRLVMVRN